MKRTALYISSALLLIVGLCLSCQKEQNFLEEKGASVNEVIVKATIGGADTKVSFTEDGSTLKTAWENDDHIVGWDKDGNAIELEIASIDNGTAIFKTVEGSSAIPTGGKVYMIYAPGKSKSNISNKSLEYSLADQGSGKLPALMTATGEVSGNVLSLTFANQLAIVAVKNPTFPVTEATPITELTLSGSNIQTKATFSMDGETLKMESSVAGDITRTCNFTTAANGTTTETMVYFAVLPNSTAAEVTVSTTAPTGYQISFSDKSFTAGQCYLLDQKTIGKQKFTLTAGTTTNGGISFENGSETITSGSSVAWGTEVTVTAAPSEGYELDGAIAVTGATSGSIPLTDNKFTMPKENVTVSGSFKKKDYTISATGTEASGTYTVTGGTYTIKKDSDDVTTAQIGDEITVDATPADGYLGGTVTVKKTGTDEGVTFDATNKTFTMPASPVTITVTFRSGYSITKATATNGSFTVKKGGTEVDSADSQDEITIEAVPATGYVVDAIGVRDADDKAAVAVTGDDKFTMPAKAVTVTVTFKPNPTNEIGGHEYVEIGGKKWATTNLGADIPQYYGNLYSWGENAPKEDYSSKKYIASVLSGDIDPTSEYDAANKNWESSWHMPTNQDFIDLAANCVWIWTTDYKKTGVSGYIVYVAKDNSGDEGKADMDGTWKKWDGSRFSTSGASAATGTYVVTDPHIFFPAAGQSGGTSRLNGSFRGYYWSRTLNPLSSSTSAYGLYFNSLDVDPQSPNNRNNGRSVRPVSD